MLDLRRKVPQNHKGSDIRDRPIPNGELAKVLKRRLNDVIHKAGVDGQDGDKKTEQQDAIAQAVLGPGPTSVALLLHGLQVQRPD